MPVQIHLLTNPKFLGDKNQALGIKKQLEKQAEAEVTEWNDSDESQLDALNKRLLADTQTQQVLIAIGDHGLQALRKIERSSRGKLLTIYASHQILPELEATLDRMDILALPTHLLDTTSRQSLSKPHLQLVETLGVVHNMCAAELDAAYAAWQNDASLQIRESERYIALLLGGDAPEPNGTMRYFSAQGAEDIGVYFVELYQQYKAENKPLPLLLITNSPRTGKYDPITQQELPVHTGADIDATSKALLKIIDKHGIPHQFLDYVAGKASAYKPIMAVLLKNCLNLAFVTGDSTSMVTEIGDILEPTQLNVIPIDSMNASHQAHIRSIQDTQYAQVVTLENGRYHFRQSTTPTHSNKRETAAECIATAVKQALLVRAVESIPFTNLDILPSQSTGFDASTQPVLLTKEPLIQETPTNNNH